MYKNVLWRSGMVVTCGLLKFTHNNRKVYYYYLYMYIIEKDYYIIY